MALTDEFLIGKQVKSIEANTPKCRPSLHWNIFFVVLMNLQCIILFLVTTLATSSSHVEGVSTTILDESWQVTPECNVGEGLNARELLHLHAIEETNTNVNRDAREQKDEEDGSTAHTATWSGRSDTTRTGNTRLEGDGEGAGGLILSDGEGISWWIGRTTEHTQHGTNLLSASNPASITIEHRVHHTIGDWFNDGSKGDSAPSWGLIEGTKRCDESWW